MKEYSLVLPDFKTQAGQFSIIKEKPQFGGQRYYALEISPNFDGKNLMVEFDNRELLEENNCFRLYEEIITFNNKTLYLFKYVEGQRQSIEQLIEKTRNNFEQVPIEKINILLSQVLECLYQLHKLNILGRQFSTHNILECDGRVIMMDFGFCPALLSSDFSYLFPPELDYISQKNTSFQNLEVYTSKLDSWLLGAFLYHLVKLNPINMAKRNSTHILPDTSRYSGSGICEFIQKLLVFNSRDRLSFFDIYNSNYVQRLQLQRPIKEYQNFYQGFAYSQPLIENIITRDYSFLSSLFDSRNIINKTQIQGQLELMSLDFTNLNLPSLEEYNESSAPPNSDQGVTKEFFYKPFAIQSSNFYKFWYYINFEQYRCYMLLNTADDIITNLAMKNLEIEMLASYILKKMCYIILVELITKLQLNECQWVDDQQSWMQFKQDNQFKLLILALNSKKKEFQISLISQFQSDCKKYINDRRLDDQLRNSLKDDLDCNFIYSHELTSENFLRSGFRQMTICIFNFLMNICNVFEDLRLTQNTLILKIVCCHLINRIFTIELQTNFINLRPQYGPQLLPDDINDLISHSNRKEKIKQIQYLLDLYFYIR